MINNNQYRELIIRPSLKAIDLYSINSEELLILTLAQESLGLSFLKQVNGPALGPYMIEPKTHDDIWNNYLANNKDLRFKILETLNLKSLPTSDRLVYDLKYATIMARVFFLRISSPIPLATDIKGLAGYWKRFYNSENGKGTPEEAIDNYRRFIAR